MILVDACCRAGVWNTQDLSQDHWSISAAWLPGIPPGWLSHCVFTIISYHYISYHYIAVPLQRRILHISWHDFVSNDEVLSRTGLFDVSYIVRKRRLGLFGHVARLQSDVPANQILRICTKTRDGDRPSQEWRRASGRPPTTWIHQICCDTEALQLAEDRRFWRTIATAGGFGWSLRVTTSMDRL